MTDKVLYGIRIFAALQIELQEELESGVLSRVRIKQEADAYRHIDCKENDRFPGTQEYWENFSEA